MKAQLASLAAAYVLVACQDPARPSAPLASTERDASVASALDAKAPARRKVDERGRDIFRFDTFGDETFWTDTLQMHTVIATNVSPNTALAVGLKVDAAALPPAVVQGIQNGTIKLDDPATTVVLLKLGAVVGVVGQVNGENKLTRVGITCALCHSTVDNSFAAGIGARLDGWPNRSLDVGRIVALSPALTPAQKTVYNSWGPGKYDPRFNIDGLNTPVVLPPAFGLRGVRLETYTGDGPVSYWNAYVAITQMHGHGIFRDPRIGVVKSNPPDLVSSKLEPLLEYQLSLDPPEARPGTYNREAARKGRVVFTSVAGCARCHMGKTLTDVNIGRLHAPAEVGQDPAYAMRSATKRYRTTPLRGLWNPPQLTGPYFHDGKATTLEAVVEHYVKRFNLTLTAQQKADLVEYLKTL